MIGFGTWGFSGKEYGSISKKKCVELLKYAYKKNIRFIDTAPIYGNGKVEKILSKFLNKKIREQIVICTKCGMLPHEGFKMKQNFSNKNILKDLNKSLQNLKTNYIDILLLHSPDVKKINMTRIINLSKKLKDQKIIKYFGISVRSPQDINEIRNLNQLDYVELNFNLLDQRALKFNILSKLKRFKIKSICRTPLAFGFLADKTIKKELLSKNDHRKIWSQEQFDAWNKNKNFFERFQKIYKDKKISSFALRYCLSNKFNYIIPGMLKFSEIDQNLKVTKKKNISKKNLFKIHKIYLNNESKFFIQKRVR